jgi:hypothetical protein
MFLDDDPYTGAVGYITVIDGPDQLGEYLVEEQGSTYPLSANNRIKPSKPIPTLSKAQWARIKAAGFPKTALGLLAAFDGAVAPSVKPMTSRKPAPTFVAVELPTNLLEACKREGVVLSVLKTDRGIDWEPGDCNGKTLLFGGSCKTCRGDHAIHNAPACFCPWCGAPLSSGRATREGYCG